MARTFADLFPSRYLTALDLQPAGPTTVTIRAIWQSGTDVDESTGETFPQYCIAFMEFQKPAKLKSGFAVQIKEALGDNVDAWIGRQLNVQPVGVMAFGKMHQMIGLSPQQPAAGPALQPGSGQPAAVSTLAKPVRNLQPIGQTGASRFSIRLKGFDKSWEDFLANLKVTDPEAFEAAHGKALEDVPAWLLDHMKKYIDYLDRQKPITEDEIPF